MKQEIEDLKDFKFDFVTIIDYNKESRDKTDIVFKGRKDKRVLYYVITFFKEDLLETNKTIEFKLRQIENIVDFKVDLYMGAIFVSNNKNKSMSIDFNRKNNIEINLCCAEWKILDSIKI